MCKHPLIYGVGAAEHESDPTLRGRSREIIVEAARTLDERKMTRYDSQSDNLAVTNLGRVASHFYIRNESVHTFNAMMEKLYSPTDADLLHIDVSCFKQIVLYHNDDRAFLTSNCNCHTLALVCLPPHRPSLLSI